jgi:hypothetical protein
MKLWIDDVRPAPEGYIWCKSVKAAKDAIEARELLNRITWHYENDTKEHLHPFELIDIDHDAGDYAHLGGDYIKLLDWLEETGRSYPIRIHSMNPVGRENMRAIIRRNGWTEVM